MTEDIKQALLNCFSHVAWIDEHGQDYYDALEDALYPPVTLASISAVYTQSGTVYDSASLDSLKSDLVVTAHYSDSSTATVTSYTLSGTLTVGTSTITVAYGGKTTAFTVTVTATPTLSSISATYTQSGTVYNTDDLSSLASDLVVTATYSDSSTTTVSYGDYTLSGTLSVGTSTITVTCDGCTDTFTVTVTEYVYVPTPVYELASATTFDGSSTYIDTGYVLTNTDKDFSIAFEFSPNNPANGATIFDASHNYSGGLQFWLPSNGSGNYSLVIVTNGGTLFNKSAFTTNAKIVLTHVRGESAINATYTLDDSATSSTATVTLNGFGTNSNYLSSTQHVILGSRYDRSGRFFTGTINQFIIYEEVLGASAINSFLGVS